MFRAPVDCTQYFTGTAGTIQTYNFGQLLGGLYYTNCLRTEAGYCGVQFKESTGTTPDAFQMTAAATTNAEVGKIFNKSMKNLFYLKPLSRHLSTWFCLHP